MKKALVILSSLLVAAGAFAQGTVNFALRVTGTYDAPVFLDTVGGPNKASGAAYLAQLYAGPAGASAGGLTAIGSPVPFLTGAGAGYIKSATATLASVAPGATASIQIRAWAVSAGADYATAVASGSGFGQSAILQQVTGGAGNPPGLPTDLAGLASFAITTGIVPEPSTLALGALGGLALLLRRRK